MAFFPVASKTVTATSVTATTILPTGGPIIRVARESTANRVFIIFGGSSVSVTTTTGCELIGGVVEEFVNPNPNLYTYFAVITVSGSVDVNISVGPTF